jgi:uncharacterized protein YaiI (UPF0178 family)
MVKLSKFEEANLKAKKLQSCFFNPTSFHMKEKKNNVWITDFIDPNKDLADDEIVKLSIPKAIVVDTA